MNPDPLRRYLRRRDRRSFTRLVEAERDMVLGAALRLLGDRARAEDATQEVFMSLLPPDGPQGPDDVPQHGRAWLVRRTLQIARDQARSDRRRRARETTHSESRLDEPELSSAERAELRDAVERLPEPQRTCVELRYFGGLAAREIASMLGVARRSVDERLAQARVKLRSDLSTNAGMLLTATLAPEWRSPTVDASPALRARLEALAVQAGGVTVAGGLGAWASGAGVVALVVVAAIWSRGGDDDASPQVAAAPTVTADEELANVDDQALAPVAGAAERSDAGSTVDPARARTSEPTPEFEPAFIVEVVDESGAFVRDGTLVLAIPHSSDGGERPAGPESGPWVLGPRPLAEANPLSLPEMPAELEGSWVEARAFAEGYGSAAPRRLAGTDDELPRVVRLVLPTPRDLDLEVLVNGSEEAVHDALIVATSELERIDAEISGASTPVDGRFVVRTDALGRCRLVGLGGGNLYLEVYADGYRTKQVAGLDPGGSERVYLVPDSGKGSIEVTVLDPDGGAVRGVDVRCRYQSMSGSSVLATDADGRARFEGLSAGHWVVELDPAQLSGWKSRHGWSIDGAAALRRVYVGDGAAEQVTLGYSRGDAAWRIELVDSDGVPVTGRHVTLRKESTLEGETDETGVVLFENLEPGAWYFTAGNGWDPGAHLVKAGETLRTRMVIGDRTVRGRVVLEDGSPVARANLAFGDRYMASAVTDDDGTFELAGAPPGEYYVHVHVFGYPGVTIKLAIEPGLDPAPLELVVPRGGKLLVELPGAAARHLRIAAVSESGSYAWLQTVPTATETFVSAPLAPGMYTFEVRKGRTTLHTTTEPVSVRADETTEARVEMPK